MVIHKKVNMKMIPKFELNKSGSITIKIDGSIRYWFLPEYEIVRLICLKDKETFGIMIKRKDTQIYTNIVWLN